MNRSVDMPETPSQLDDAISRMTQARDNYMSLSREMDEFLYQYVKRMVGGFDQESGDFNLYIRHPKESHVSGKPPVLVSQIVENLRTALDYMVFQLSALNEPELNAKLPQFVISDSEAEFKSQAKTRLRYLSDEQKGFVEKLQPYNGNEVLALLGNITVQGKHRHLLSIRAITSLDICFAEVTKREEFEGYLVYPVGNGAAIFAKPIDRPVLLLIEKYDAMVLLNEMIGHVWDILRVSYLFFRDGHSHSM